jgi:hypothetical protein
MTLDTMKDEKKRTVMSVWDVFGQVGGIQQVFMVVSVFLLSFYSQITFVIEASDAMFEIKSNNNKMKRG